MPLGLTGQEAVWRGRGARPGARGEGDRRLPRRPRVNCPLRMDGLASTAGAGRRSPSWIDRHAELGRKNRGPGAGAGQCAGPPGLHRPHPPAIRRVFPAARLRQLRRLVRVPGTSFSTRRTRSSRRSGRPSSRSRPGVSARTTSTPRTPSSRCRPRATTRRSSMPWGSRSIEPWRPPIPRRSGSSRAGSSSTTRSSGRSPSGRPSSARSRRPPGGPRPLLRDEADVVDHGGLRREALVFCIIHSFGDQVSLHGGLPQIAGNLRAAIESPRRGRLSGVGLIMEGLGNNRPSGTS